jgi:hypothetical protein
MFELLENFNNREHVDTSTEKYYNRTYFFHKTLVKIEH